MRLPYRERLTIIINELGTGLAGQRRRSCAQAIKQRQPGAPGDRQGPERSSPTRTRRWPTSPRTATRSSRPLARDQAAASPTSSTQARHDAQAHGRAPQRPRGRTSQQAARPSCASSRPTMQRLGGAVADQMTPVLTDLGAAAPPINRFIEQLGPFTAAATPALAVARRRRRGRRPGADQGASRSSPTSVSFAGRPSRWPRTSTRC